MILFGTLFNDIHISRRDSANNLVSFLKVPLQYGPKEKSLARVDADPAIDRPFSVVLPMMTFEMLRIRYDGSRKLPTVNKVVVKSANNANSLKYQYNPVPYNIDFELTILVKNAEDGTKIVEQILPFFTPDWTSTVKLIPEMNVIMDIPIVLNTIDIRDAYEGNFKKRRSLMWVLNFTLKGYIYGPVKEGKVIKFANTNFYIATTDQIRNSVNNLDPTLTVQIQPGLTANGTPTSNSASSIPVSDIEADDDFGYVIDITEGPIES